MTKKDLLENKAFMEAPDDAQIISSYVDFFGDNECTLDVYYNQYSNRLYLSPGESIKEE